VVNVASLIFLTAISRNRGAPGNTAAPKSTCTVKAPAVTVTLEIERVAPCCAPALKASKSLNSKSNWPLAGLLPSVSRP
jgi:hypothetical protein